MDPRKNNPTRKGRVDEQKEPREDIESQRRHERTEPPPGAREAEAYRQAHPTVLPGVLDPEPQDVSDFDPTLEHDAPTLQEDRLEARDDIDALAVRASEIPRGFVRGRWHKVRRRMAVAVPMILIMYLTLIITGLAGLMLAMHGVAIDTPWVWNTALPFAGTVAAAAALLFARRWWPKEERSGPMRPVALGMAVSTVIIASVFSAIALAALISPRI